MTQTVSRGFLALLLVSLSSCGGSESLTGDATEPGISPPAAMTIVSGDAQVDTVGKELSEPLVVRVVNAQDAPVRQQVVNFRVLAGGGSVFAGVAITNEAGEARERWTLGTVAGETQTVEARAVDTQTGAPLIFATFTAVGVPDTATTVLILGDSVVRLTALGDTATLSATVVDRFENEVAPQPTVDWMSSDTLIAIISPGGMVTASGPGSATIAASSENLTTTVGVTVEQVVASIVLSTDSLILAGPGDTATVAATVLDSGNSDLN